MMDQMLELGERTFFSSVKAWTMKSVTFLGSVEALNLRFLTFLGLVEAIEAIEAWETKFLAQSLFSVFLNFQAITLGEDIKFTDKFSTEGKETHFLFCGCQWYILKR